MSSIDSEKRHMCINTNRIVFTTLLHWCVVGSIPRHCMHMDILVGSILVFLWSSSKKLLPVHIAAGIVWGPIYSKLGPVHLPQNNRIPTSC